MRQLAPHTDVNGANYEGRTPLHVAASGGSLEAVDLLIELGSAVSPLDSSGNTPLDDALRQGYANVAVNLEAKGAYSGVSFRKLAQSKSPLRRSYEACVVPLSLGDNARNFAAFTQQGVIALGSELEISIEGTKAKPKLVSAGCLGPSIVGNYSCHGAERLPGGRPGRRRPLLCLRRPRPARAHRLQGGAGLDALRGRALGQALVRPRRRAHLGLRGRAGPPTEPGDAARACRAGARLRRLCSRGLPSGRVTHCGGGWRLPRGHRLGGRRHGLLDRPLDRPQARPAGGAGAPPGGWS